MERVNPASFGQLPVLPLPSTVLFPGTVLPLQIVEPCYREMVADVIKGDGMLGAVMLREDSDASVAPAQLPLHEVGCAGQLIHAERLPDGRYNILLQGTHRVRLIEELPAERAYRCFRAQVIPAPAESALEQASLELGRLESCVLSLGAAFKERDAQLCEVLRATEDPVKLVDILCAALIPDPGRQQSLLANEDFAARLRELIDVLADLMARSGPGDKVEHVN